MLGATNLEYGVYQQIKKQAKVRGYSVLCIVNKHHLGNIVKSFLAIHPVTQNKTVYYAAVTLRESKIKKDAEYDAIMSKPAWQDPEKIRNCGINKKFKKRLAQKENL